MTQKNKAISTISPANAAGNVVLLLVVFFNLQLLNILEGSKRTQFK